MPNVSTLKKQDNGQNKMIELVDRLEKSQLVIKKQNLEIAGYDRVLEKYSNDIDMLETKVEELEKIVAKHNDAQSEWDKIFDALIKKNNEDISKFNLDVDEDIQEVYERLDKKYRKRRN